MNRSEGFMELKMDDYSSSSSSSRKGVFLSKKGPGLSLRDTSTNTNNRDQSQTTTTPVCSRVGCGSRMSSSTTTSSSSILNKSKSAKQQLPSHSSTNGKRVVVAGGSSSSSKQQKQSGSPPLTTKPQPPSVLDCQRKSQPDSDVVTPNRNIQDRPSSSSSSSQHALSTPSTPKTSQSRLKPSSSLQGNVSSRQFIYREVNNTSSSSGSGSTTSHTRNTKKSSSSSSSGGACELNDHTTTSSPSAAFRTGTRNVSASTSTRNVFRKCNPTSCDPGPSGCSSPSSSSHSGKKEMGRKRNSEGGESSTPSVKGKRMSGGGAVGGSPLSDDKKANNVSNRGTSGGISLSDSRRVRTHLASSGRDGSSSGGGTLVRSNTRTRTARTTIIRSNGVENNSRHRLVRRNESSSSILGAPRITLADDNDVSVTGSGYQSSAASSSGLTATIESMLGDRTAATAPFEIGFGGRSSTNRENLRLYNLDGITEMLLALERIEQNEELSYEQLLALESNLFLGGSGLSFHDQHRDMRLDIDNMSYEELLALEERIGTVSTALTEEALEKCVEKGVFQGGAYSDPAAAAAAKEEKVAAAAASVIGEVDDDLKCCICQEEYIDGDKVGRLGCEHRYHADCIKQWLRLKNWCPICKVEVLQQSDSSTAEPPPPPPPAAAQPISSAPVASELLS